VAGSVNETLGHIRADIMVANREIAAVVARVQPLMAAKAKAERFVERKGRHMVGSYEDIEVGRELHEALARFQETR
jgi:hypothetical protein